MPRQRHLPGVVLVGDDGPSCRVDRVDERSAVAFSVTRQVREAVGWAHRLVGGLDPVRVADLLWMAGHRHPRYAAAGLVAAVRAARGVPAPLMDQAAMVGDPIKVLPVVFPPAVVWDSESGPLPSAGGPQVGRAEVRAMSGLLPRGVLSVGDRARFGDRVQSVVGPAGTLVRLVDDHGAASLLLFSHLPRSRCGLDGRRPCGCPRR